MSEITFILSIHHGGRFVDDSRRRYVGGKVTQVCDALDIDKISYPEIISYVKEDLQYELESIDGLYYHKQGNFVVVKDDQAILSIVSELCDRAKLEFYVNHKNLAKQVTLSKQTEVIDGGSLEVNQGVDLSDDNDSEDDLLQQTFDNLNKDIVFLTDDDDEEVQMSRKNIRSFKEKNTFNGKDNTRCDDELDAYAYDIIYDSQEDDGLEDDAQEEEDNGLEDGNDSDGSFYYDSDDCCSYYSESDEECGDHALRKPSEMVRFDPMATIPVFCCGMIFQNVQECRDALAKYAIMKGLQIRFIKNDQVRVRAECMEKCPWKFLASKNSHNNDFEVKTYVPNHKCYRKNTNPMATSKSLSKLLKDRLLATPFIKYRDLKNLCKTELKLKISLTQARNIRKRVIADLLGSYTEEYKRLHDYVQEINSSNPGTTCVVKASKDEGGDINHFRCFYVCFAACKKGWTEGCRNIIGLDGCFLKGVCKGQLLCAVGRDGNNQMFPIAWAVVSVENKENWGWFLNLLKYDLAIGDGAELTIISDMQKGLDSAINEHLPEVEHRMCARHVYAAWAKKWKGEERKIAFWKCARSTFENDFKSKLREMNLLGNGILEDFMRYNVESFSKAYFRTTPKCDSVDNNMAETFNGWILDARCKPIISMLEDIRVQVMRRLYAKRKFCSTWICAVGPRPMQKLERNKEFSFKWQMIWNGDEGYEVSNVYDQDNRHIVNLKSSSCTCREWELTGIPCQHAVCVLHSEGLEPENFVAHWYVESTYLKAYQFMIQPVRGKILWAETGKEEIAPPVHRKLPGRPKVKRKKDKNEIQKAGKLSRKGRIMTCKICKQPGHNIRRCPQKMNMPGEDNVTSLEQYATNKSLSQSRSEMRDGQSSKRHNGSVQLGKRSRPTKSRMTKGSTNHPTGYGLYINENTGHTVLNPGIRSNKYVKTHQETMYSRPSEDANKDVRGSKNQTTSGLKWKGNTSMTTRQLQVEAQRKITTFTTQAKERK